MATRTTPPLPPRRGGKSHKLKRVPTRSARRFANGSVSTGTDVPHMVRVTVLGLAGVTVNHSKCRSDSSVSKSKSLPPLPSNMRALVAFSRTGDIRGTTTLSKPLTISPKNQVLLCSGDAEEDHWTGIGEDDRTRHVAVWSSGNNIVGSEVVFDIALHRSDMGMSSASVKSGRSSNASSAFAPKSFDVTIALTEDDDLESKIAIPFGVANLAIAGDECANGNVVTLDLPVLSLEQARPLGSVTNKNGSAEHPLISIQRNQDAHEVKDLNKKKKNSLKRRFFKNKISSMMDRNAFLEAYSIDASGDAVLRVTLEVYEKGKRELLDYNKREPKLKVPTSISNRITADDASAPSDEGRPPATIKRSLSYPDDEISAVSEQLKIVVPPRQSSRMKNDVVPAIPEESSTTATSSSDALSTNDESFYTEDGTFVEIDATTASSGSSTEATDDYTLSFSKKDTVLEQRNGEDAEEENSVIESVREKLNRHFATCKVPLENVDGKLYVKMFGRKVYVPTCRGPLPRDFEYDDEGNGKVNMEIFGRSVKVPVCGALIPADQDEEFDNESWTTYTNANTANSMWDDDVTMVTAKLFGHKLRVPLPRHLLPKPKQDDLDTVTAATSITGTNDFFSTAEDPYHKGPAPPNPYQQRANIGSTYTFEDHTLGETTVSFIDGSSLPSWIGGRDEEAMVVEIDHEHASSTDSESGSEEERSLDDSFTVSSCSVTQDSTQDLSSDPTELTKPTVSHKRPKEDNRKLRGETRANSFINPSSGDPPRAKSHDGGSTGKSSPRKNKNHGTMVVEIDQDHPDSESEPTMYKLPDVKNGSTSSNFRRTSTQSRKARSFASGKKSSTQGSPKGVEDIAELYSPPARDVQDERNHISFRPITMAQAFTDFITCRNPTTIGSYGSIEEEVPPIIIGSLDDDSSIGDLTATTHEQQITSAHNNAKNRKKNESNESDDRTNFAFSDVLGAKGGDDADESLASMVTVKENYFSEYGEDNSLHPMNGKKPFTRDQEKKVTSSDVNPTFIKPWVEEGKTNRSPQQKRSGFNPPKGDRFFSTEAGHEVTPSTTGEHAFSKGEPRLSSSQHEF